MGGSGEELVQLRGGCTARLAACLLLLRLEAEGFTLELDPDDQLFVTPIDGLRPGDAETLRQYRPDVTRLLRYSIDDSHLRANHGLSTSPKWTDRPV